MQAVILAGGFGTRLAPLTYTKTKAMLPLLNRPMISHLLDSLPPGIDIIVAANYKIEQLKNYFKDMGITVIINKEPKPLGTAGAVKNVERYIDGTFLVLNSDIIASINIRKFIQYHLKKKSYATISLWPVKNVEEYGVVDMQPSGRLVRFVEKPLRHEAPSNLINAGAYCLNSDILDYIKTDSFSSMETEIFPQIIDDGKAFFGFTFNGYWLDVGRHTSYLNATQLLLKKRGLRNFVGDSNIKGFLKESTVGNGCKIEQGAELKSCIVFDNCIIGAKSILINCIIADNCIIGKEAHLNNVVIGANETVGDRIILEQEKLWTKPIPHGYPNKQIGNPLKKN